MSVTLSVEAPPEPVRLLVAEAARQCGASEPTTMQLVSWVRAFVLFHGKQHPHQLGLPAVNRFLEHVVRTQKQPLAALETARSAMELLYGPVLGMDLGELPRPRPRRLLDQMSQVLRVRAGCNKLIPRKSVMPARSTASVRSAAVALKTRCVRCVLFVFSRLNR